MAREFLSIEPDRVSVLYSDDKLFSHSERVKDKVLVITGAANGIGKETALKFAFYGAKVVIGDLDVSAAQAVVSQIQKAGGSAVAIPCNVTEWDDQVMMFELAMRKYGSVDIVVPNAGISEAGSFRNLRFEDGKPQKPSMKTLEVNLFGVLYTTHLAIHYLQQGKRDGDFKALVLIGSMASWQSIPLAELYSASKHAVLGVMRAIHPMLEAQGIRTACIHPFFVDTGILPLPVKLVLAGIPMTPVSRVAGAIFYAATDPDMATNGSAWLLTDDGPVFLVPREEFKMGVYKMMDERANAARAALRGITAWFKIFADLWRITHRPILTTIVFALVVFTMMLAWGNAGTIHGYARDLVNN